MTSTQLRPPRVRRPSEAPPVADPTAVRRTLIALGASALGIIPLKGLFSDDGWLLDVWLTMVVVLGPAALLRRRRAPGALDIWPGIVLMVPWLTLRFVHQHAVLGVLPGPGAWHDVSLLLTDLHETTRDEVAPIHTTVAVRLVVCALLGLVAALVDLVAVVGHRGALAGVPLLVVYTVAGAVPRRPVSWFWFAFAAVGYLLLLGLDSEDVIASWGRRIRPPKGSRGANSVSVTTPRIAAAAVVVAIVLPLIVPAQSRNLISNAFHHDGGGGSGSGIGGFGGGSVGAIAPFAAVRGELRRPTPVNLMTVKMIGHSRTEPFYLRVNVLSDYTGDGWRAATHGPTTGIGGNGYPGDQLGASEPYPTVPAGIGTAEQLTARISLDDQVRGNPPVFAVPSSIDGLDGVATWSARDQIVLGEQVESSTSYTETFQQPAPTSRQLLATGTSNSNPQISPYLTLPGNIPQYATRLVSKLTRGDSALYAKALALNNYFTEPKNGFTYSLETKAGDSGSALEDFLKTKQGFCQQYAAAEAVMLRVAGVPSRVVLGYMHPATGTNGSFTVSTQDAHAWVEAYFPGQGWIPFDPTPSSGLAGGARTDLPWAPHKDLSGGATSGGAEPTVPRNRQSSTAPSAATSTSPKVGAIGPKHTPPTSFTPLWWVLGGLALVALVLAPAGVRHGRRRTRLTAARRSGDAGALWAELSDTAVDLGYPWSTARTPRQVAGWLTRDAPSSASLLSTLADAVERQRYAHPGRPSTDAASLVAGLRAVLAELRARRTRGSRLRATFWPASLGWGRTRLASARGPVGWFARHRD